MSRKTLSRIVPLLAMIAFLTAPSNAHAQTGSAQTGSETRFQLTIASQLLVEAKPGVEKVSTLTNIAYTWKRKGALGTLFLDSIELQGSRDGREIMDLFLSRERVKNNLSGQFDEKTLKDAPPGTKAMMEDSFGNALYTIRADADGRIVEKTKVAREGAKEFIEGGTVAGAFLFHAPFVRGQERWIAPAEVTIGNGGFATGNLTYEKLANENGRMRVKVSGLLTKDRFKPAGSPIEVKNARYEVTGEQTFDEKRQEWIDGELTFDLSFQMEANGIETASSKGIMKLRLKTR
ncbi:MAG: hypothetical protein HY040_15790 [Planctomycetes bacterium]|nr:hypothetical protein [Planctomycetota bacterium]